MKLFDKDIVIDNKKIGLLCFGIKTNKLFY